MKDNSQFEQRVSTLSLSPDEASRLEQIMSTDISYVFHQDFCQPSRMAEILEEEIPISPDNRPDAEQERIVFMQLNYFRYRRDTLRESFLCQTQRPRAEVQELIESDERQQDLRNKLVTCNLGPVMKMAHRARPYGLDYDDLVSEGNMALLRAADRFDCSYGCRFSTYACRVIIASLSRLTKKHYRFASRFPVSWELFCEKDDYVQKRREENVQEQAHAVNEMVRDNLADLSERDLSILRMRFSLDGGVAEPMTLKSIGHHLNLSKERIRQIQGAALDKIRLANDEIRMVV